MKYFLIAVAASIIISCNNDPAAFINHELKAVKKGDCSMPHTPPNMNSNTSGERYLFDYCLEDGFDGKNYKVDRKGDSLVVSFPGAADAKKKSLYSLTLDIDAKPLYRYIILGDQAIELGHSQP